MAADEGRNVVEEAEAIKVVVEALHPLRDQARRQVLAYVAEALGIEGLTKGDGSTRDLAAPVPEPVHRGAGAPAAVQDQTADVRTLKDQKQPRSATEMAALVAYYLSELLPADERRQVITAADIEKYFKQANFRLPSRVAQTLPDAARAGYFDAIDRGQYKLNPVGYNLVAHGLPSGENGSAAKPKKAAPARRASKRADTKLSKKAKPAKRSAAKRK